MAAPGNLDLMELYNAFLSPEAKQRRMDLENSQKANAWENSPEYAQSHGNIPVGALPAERAYQEIEGVKAATRFHLSQAQGGEIANRQSQVDADASGGHSNAFTLQQAQIPGIRAQTRGAELGNQQTETDMGLNGGRSLAQTKFTDMEKPQSDALIQHYKSVANLTDEQIKQMALSRKDTQTATGGKFSTPEAAKYSLEAADQPSLIAQRGAETAKLQTEMANFFPQDPKQQEMFVHTLEGFGYNTDQFKKMMADKKAGNAAELSHLLGGGASPARAPMHSSPIQDFTGKAPRSVPRGVQETQRPNSTTSSGNPFQTPHVGQAMQDLMQSSSGNPAPNPELKLQMLMQILGTGGVNANSTIPSEFGPRKKSAYLPSNYGPIRKGTH